MRIEKLHYFLIKTKAFYLIAFLAFLFLFLGAEKSLGCVCGTSPTVYEGFETSDAVFIGRAINSKDIETVDKNESIFFSGKQRIYRFEIQTSYKGLKTDIIDVNTGIIDSSCSSDFAIGKTYLVYANKAKGKTELRAFRACGLIEEFENAKDQISIINWILKKEPEPQVYGSLIFSDESDNDSFLKNIKVQAISDKEIFEATTDENGVFKFPNLPQGSYTIKPVLPETQRVDFADTEAIIVTENGRIYTDKFADDIKELVEDFEDSKSELTKDELQKKLRKTIYTEFHLAFNYGVTGRVLDNEGKVAKCKMVALVSINSLDKLGDLAPKSRHVLWNVDKFEDGFASAWKWCEDDGSFSISAKKSGKYVLATEIEIGNSLTKVFFRPQTDTYKYAEIINFDKPKQLKLDIKLPNSVLNKKE